jgi:single-strand DNA-binding protein
MTQLVGVLRIGRDAELRAAGQTSVINLALAYNYGKKEAGGDKPTQWIDASLWGKRAEALEQYLVKGQQIYAVISDVHIETYDKRDGGTGSKLVGVIADLELVGGRAQPAGDRDERPARREAAPARREAPKPAPAQGGFDDMDDDIPF